MDKKKYEVEFIINASPKILFSYLSTPSGLSEWFSDDVNIRDNVYTFFWDGEESRAKSLTNKKDESVKYQWIDEDNPDEFAGTYFEFLIKVDPMTRDTALIVTDFAEEDEIDSAMKLWESQISELKHILGL